MPPAEHEKFFENEVWNVFNALGLKYIAIPFPKLTSSIHRLVPPHNTKYADFHVIRSVIVWLINCNLAKQGEGKPPKFNNLERPVWYVLTEQGQKAFDELSAFDNFEDKFTERFRPSCT